MRDLDVQLERTRAVAAELDIAQAMDPYVAWLEEKRQRTRTKLAGAFESRRFGALVQHLQRLDAWAFEVTADLYADAPGRLLAAHKQLRKRARAVDKQSAASDLHVVRIRAKRLRYTTEFFEVAYGKPARQLVVRVVALQDLLGNLQDSIVSRENIHEAVREAGAWPVEASLALGQVIQHEAQQERDIRQAFPAAYRAVRDGWKRLQRALRRGAATKRAS